MPPEFLFHVAQMDVVVDEELRGQPEATRNHGKQLVYAHDIGRTLDQKQDHTRVGAHLLRDLGFDPSLINFALAHHHWGLGVHGLSSDNFSGRVDAALSNGGIHSIVDDLVQKQGIDAPAVLLADNSKRSVAADSFYTEIYIYNLRHADHLIRMQVERGRLVPDTAAYQKELLGAKFLHALIPEMEKRLGIFYPEVIARARERWPEAREIAIAKWQNIASHHLNVSLH
jgi:putative nucleotidyltransferase with HDIG domain